MELPELTPLEAVLSNVEHWASQTCLPCISGIQVLDIHFLPSCKANYKRKAMIRLTTPLLDEYKATFPCGCSTTRLPGKESEGHP